jgi:hypothetical protein
VHHELPRQNHQYGSNADQGTDGPRSICLTLFTHEPSIAQTAVAQKQKNPPTGNFRGGATGAEGARIASNRKKPAAAGAGRARRRRDPISGPRVPLQDGLLQVSGYQQRARSERAGGIQELPQLRYRYGDQLIQGVMMSVFLMAIGPFRDFCL